MADKKKAELDKKQKQELKAILDQLGASGRYADLIHQAIVFDWSPQRFVTALTRSQHFRNQFPGLLDRNGDIQPFLSGAENTSVSVSSLGSAVKAYNTLWHSYETAGQRFGMGQINRAKLATLIKNEISPDEFGRRAFAIKTVHENPAEFATWKQEAAAAGIKDFNPYRAAARVGDQKFYDVYEATRLRTLGQGLGFGTKQALDIAKALPNVDSQGRKVGFGDVASLVKDLRNNLSDVGPELEAAGISHVEIAKYLANPTADTTGFEQKLANIVNAKRARGAFVPGYQAQQGTAGGPALYKQEGAAAY